MRPSELNSDEKQHCGRRSTNMMEGTFELSRKKEKQDAYLLWQAT